MFIANELTEPKANSELCATYETKAEAKRESF